MQLSNAFHRLDQYVQVMSFNDKRQGDLLQELGGWIIDGTKPIEAVSRLMSILENRGKFKTPEYKALNAIHDSLASGKTIADGMRGYFSSNFVAIFEAGQTSGTFKQTIEMFLDSRDRFSKMRRNFIIPVALGGFLLTIMTIVCISSVHKVFPPLIEAKKQGVPDNVQLFMDSMLLIQHLSIFIPFVAIGLFLGIRKFLTNYTGKSRAMVDTWIGFDFYRTLCANQLLSMVAVMTKSGISLRESIYIVHDSANKYLRYHCDKALTNNTSGNSNIGETLDTGLINDEVMQRLYSMTAVETHEQRINGVAQCAVRSLERAEKTSKKSGYSVGVILAGLMIALLLWYVDSLFTLGMT